MTIDKITSPEEYQKAKEQLKEMFNSDACLVDMNEANELMKAMDCYERDCAKIKATYSSKDLIEEGSSL